MILVWSWFWSTLVDMVPGSQSFFGFMVLVAGSGRRWWIWLLDSVILLVPGPGLWPWLLDLDFLMVDSGKAHTAGPSTTGTLARHQGINNSSMDIGTAVQLDIYSAT